MWPARTVFTFQRQSGICRCTKGSRHEPANIKGVLCCTFGQGRDFSFKGSSRERVSYLKGCLSHSLDAASPSFELQSPCKCTQKGGKKPTSQYHEKADRESTVASWQREFPFATKRCERGWK